MRRLANKSREDAYSSLRDYQEIRDVEGLAFRLSGGQPRKLVLTADIPASSSDPYVGFGGFIALDRDAKVTITLEYPTGWKIRKQYEVSTDWHRVGLVTPAPEAGLATVTIEFAATTLQVWGLDCARLKLPPGIVSEDPTVTHLAKVHLLPETLYLPHEQACAIDVDESASSSLVMKPGIRMGVKKCSYCARYLPIDELRVGALSFHRHTAKRTNHQNECRACKKWRINDDLNPARTTDQLHESSVITRERKLLLREPEILQRIKKRDGDGLKSQVWKRFGKRCFKCDKPLLISEVQLDHTRPLAYLWPIDEYATCLCAECNNWKKDKFPIDVYTASELRRLSEITGLALGELKKKQVNPEQLKIILADLPGFAKEWDPRTFAGTARRVAQLDPSLDLMTLLGAADPLAQADLLARLAERPLTDEDQDF